MADPTTPMKAMFEHHQKNTADYYQMPNKKVTNHKGKVLIVNNMFQGTKDQRTGSENDVKRLKECFDKIGRCKIDVENDVAAEEFSNLVESFVLEEPKGYFYAVFIMSHGNEQKTKNEARDMILGSDGGRVDALNLVEIFTKKYQHHLSNIPVMMFFQACRGPNYDREPKDFPVEKVNPCHTDTYFKRLQTVQDQLIRAFPAGRVIDSDSPDDLDDDEPDAQDEFDLAEHLYVTGSANMLVSFSTMEGYFSFRNSGYGSWFIQDICDVLDEHAHEKDVVAMMEVVHNRISNRRSKNTDKPHFHGHAVCSKTAHTFGEKKLMMFPDY